MEGLTGILAGPIGGLVATLFVVWCVLMFFAPFFWYGTWKRTRESARHLQVLAHFAREQGEQTAAPVDPEHEGQY